MIYMKKIKEPAYFLNSIKETQPFDDEKEFIGKINESKDFRRNPDMTPKQEELNKKIALKRENLKKQQKDELLKVIFEYGEHIENFYFTMHMHPNTFHIMI